jgi:hypothetical protein
MKTKSIGIFLMQLARSKIEFETIETGLGM